MCRGVVRNARGFLKRLPWSDPRHRLPVQHPASHLFQVGELESRESFLHRGTTWGTLGSFCALVQWPWSSMTFSRLQVECGKHAKFWRSGIASAPKFHSSRRGSDLERSDAAPATRMLSSRSKVRC